MKKMIMMLAMSGALLISSCTGEKAGKENADTMYKYTDTTKKMDKVGADTTSDSTTNAPADVKN